MSTSQQEEDAATTAALVAAKIASLGDAIKAAKTAGQPKEEWDPLLREMLAAKKDYQALTGTDFGGGGAQQQSSSSSKKKAPQQPPQEAPSEKNRAKNEAKRAAKAAREAEKERKRREREQRERAKADRLAGIGRDGDDDGDCSHLFGDLPLVQSQTHTDRVWTEIGHLKPALAGQVVRVRGHLQKSVLAGRVAFCLVRSSLHSVQGVASESESGSVPRAMCRYIAGLPAESVVDVQGVVSLPDRPVQSATQQAVEVQITAFHCVCKAQRALPFQMDDACRPDSGRETDVGAYNEDEEDEAVVAEDGLIRVGQKMRLDYRWLDLRTPANQAIFRIESCVGTLFREYLLQRGFVEIHTPKLIGGASEGGSDVFTLDYFGRPACLAMSPQLHKQMAAACGGFERVFECGPVFRAENSNTRRHLCEFTGLDLEMVIHEHYDEVLHTLSELFCHIFDGVRERCAAELERVREQHPFEDLKYLRPTLRLTYAEGCALLRGAGVAQDDYEDLSTENEKRLGDLVRAKYGTDFFLMDKYPLAVRPFYTMPCPDDPRLSNSYDFFIRGQEILSGAQRIHDPDLLEERARAWGIDLADIEEYLHSFRHGALPHGGGGIGLERVVMLLLGLPNIRKSAWFPRDPRRLAP